MYRGGEGFREMSSAVMVEQGDRAVLRGETRQNK